MNAIDTTDWNLDVLRRMDWRSLEHLCAEIFREVGYEVEDTGRGADGGTDLICENAEIKFAVQCKRRKDDIEMNEVRDFFGSMAQRQIEKGAFITTGSYNNRARGEFSSYPTIELIDGEMILEGIREFPEPTRATWLEKFVGSDGWNVPTCPNCDLKMVVRNGPKGEFWGCQNYGPKKCRQTFPQSAFPIPE